MIALDYTARIPPAALHAAGVSDVCRYLCYLPVGDWKVITKGEYDELVRAGIGVTLNWELAATDWAHGESTGHAHGTEAVRMAKALGYPAGCTIIGSADFDMDRSTWDNTARFYCRGFSNAIRGGGYRPGVYGPWDVLTWVRDSGLMDVFWQAGMSTAWSGGRNRNAWPGTHLRQRRHITVAGQDCDANDIHIPTWGQMRAGVPALDGDDMGRQMLVADSSGVVWLVDGLTRSRVADVAGTGNGQAHQDALLGNLGNNGQVAKFGTPPGGMDVWGIDVAGRFAALEARVTTSEAADAIRDAAFRAAFDAFAAAVTSGTGGNIDVAPILARIDELATEETAAMTSAMAEIVELRQQIADRDARLAAALKA